MTRPVRLGCLEHDPARLAQLSTRNFGAMVAPRSVPHPLNWQPALAANDTLPNCTAVATYNAARAYSWRWGGTDLSVPTDRVVALYAAGIGMPGASDAQLAATDGADPLMVLATAQADGWDVGAQAPLVPSYGPVNATPNDIALGVLHNGAAPLALTLYGKDMDDYEKGEPWIAPVSGTPEGDHMAIIGGYYGLQPGDRVMLGTWGKWQPASWEWVMARLRLSLVTEWPQLVGPG